MLKSEWFWASIQMDACADEKMHVFSDHIGALLSPVQHTTTAPVSTPTATNPFLFSPGQSTLKLDFNYINQIQIN